MKGDNKIAVVIPCYRVAAQIEKVIGGIPAWVDQIVVVDDRCPQDSGDVAAAMDDPRVTVLHHEENRGVGGAVATGYAEALNLGCDIAVKMDGDDQMDPAFLEPLIQPLLSGSADYAKGNRFRDFAALRQMPKVRLLGNSGLSFLVKAACGYWHLMDPTNGYTAIHRRALESLELDRIDKRYFFECDLLIALNIVGAVAVDVPMPARYGDEESSLSVSRAATIFPLKLLRGFARRVALRYFVYDFNMASVYLLLGVPMVLFGLVYGLVQWQIALISGDPRLLGTALLVILPIILGFQMLLQAVSIDIDSTPKR